jgi:hypothetical protein
MPGQCPAKVVPLSSGTFRSDNEAMTPTLYAELAEWWPLLSAPEDYAEEAATWLTLLKEAGDVPPARCSSSAAAVAATPRS